MCLLYCRCITPSYRFSSRCYNEYRNLEYYTGNGLKNQGIISFHQFLYRSPRYDLMVCGMYWLWRANGLRAWPLCSAGSIARSKRGKDFSARRLSSGSSSSGPETAPRLASDQPVLVRPSCIGSQAQLLGGWSPHAQHLARGSGTCPGRRGCHRHNLSTVAGIDCRTWALPHRLLASAFSPDSRRWPTSRGRDWTAPIWGRQWTRGNEGQHRLSDPRISTTG